MNEVKCVQDYFVMNILSDLVAEQEQMLKLSQLHCLKVCRHIRTSFQKKKFKNQSIERRENVQR